MAGDWIKIRTDLIDDPNVYLMSDYLGLDIPTIVGHLVIFWGWMDRHTPDGIDIKLTDSIIDRRVGVENFSIALRIAGWLEGEDALLNLPNFDRHNGNSAKARALESEAKRLRRKAKTETEAKETQQVSDNKKQCPTTVGHKLQENSDQRREEKRREDINTHTHTRSADNRKFSMHDDWTPHPEVLELCLAGSKISPKQITQEAIREFKNHWIDETKQCTNRQWVNKLITSVSARPQQKAQSHNGKKPALHHFDNVDYHYGAKENGGF